MRGGAGLEVHPLMMIAVSVNATAIRRDGKVRCNCMGILSPYGVPKVTKRPDFPVPLPVVHETCLYERATPVVLNMRSQGSQRNDVYPL